MDELNNLVKEGQLIVNDKLKCLYIHHNTYEALSEEIKTALNKLYKIYIVGVDLSHETDKQNRITRRFIKKHRDYYKNKI